MALEKNFVIRSAGYLYLSILDDPLPKAGVWPKNNTWCQMVHGKDRFLKMSLLEAERTLRYLKTLNDNEGGNSGEHCEILDMRKYPWHRGVK